MTTSSNNAESRRLMELSRCRVGCTNAADYITPRRYFYSFSACDDFMAMQLLAVDQARVRCEDMARQIMSMPSIYRGRLKQVLRKLYSPVLPQDGPIPVCNKMIMCIIRNMTDDEIGAYATMADFIDEAIAIDMQRLRVCIHTEVGHMGIKEQDVLTLVLYTHIFTLISRTILERCFELQNGSRYSLCINPIDAECRSRSYEILPAEIDRIIDVNQMIIKELVHGRKISVPYTTEMENGITIICRKMCDMVTIFKASVEAGLDISANSGKDIESYVADIEREREKAKKQKLETKPTYSQDAIKEAFASKGWITK